MKSLSIDEGIEGVSLPAVTEKDIKWAKEIKSSQFKFQANYDSQLEKQLADGNLRRFVWLMQGERPMVKEASWKSLVDRENVYTESPDPSRWAVKALRSYKNLDKNQYAILNYLIADIRQSDEDYKEHRVVSAAIENNHLDILADLKTNISHAVDAARYNNYRALSYILAKHLNTDLSEARSELENCYYHAAGDNNLDLLSLLQAWAPVSEFGGSGFDRSLATDSYEAAEWFLQNGYDENKALLTCIGRKDYDFADKLIKHYGAKPNADDNAALDFCMERRCFDGIEYLAGKGADMSKVIEKARDAGIANSSRYDKELSHIFGNAAVSEQLIDWKKEDYTSVLRQHRTANFIHTMIFFFGEGQVVQYVTEADQKKRVGEKLWSFNEFDNQSLLQEAAEQLMRLGGDPGQTPRLHPRSQHKDTGPTPVSSVKPPLRKS
jgi:hypothetical protein